MKKLNWRSIGATLVFAVLATGCGGDSVGNSNSIEGTWYLECSDNAGTSSKHRLDINSTTMVYRMMEYNQKGCKGDAHDANWYRSHKTTYKIGAQTKAADGKDAVEIDLTKDPIEYTMYRLSNDGKVLKFAYPRDDNTHDGTSKDKREDNFNNVDTWKK